MNSLVATARNIRMFAVVNADGKPKFVPEIEAVLTVTEKEYEFVGANMVSVNKLKNIRFTMDIESAKVLLESLEEWVESAKEYEVMFKEKKD